MVYPVSEMVACLLRTVIRMRVVSRVVELMKAEATVGLDLTAVYCEVPTVVRTVG